MLCSLIRHCVSACVWAADGAQALKLADDYLPDLIVLDIGLSEIDGYAVAERLRRQPHLQSARIVALSGYQPDRTRVPASGIGDYWMKPIDVRGMTKLLAS
jgi:CheY-like chemotaxis protein